MNDQKAAGEVLYRLRALHPLIYRAIEFGVEKARGYFEAEGEPPDPYLFANLVRFHACRRLQAMTAGDPRFRVDALPNSGIEIRHASYRVRIWKEDDGGLPAPGASAAKRAYYDQPLQMAFSFPLEYLRLAVLWAVTVDLRLRAVTLACPKGYDSPWEPGDVHWQIDVPHPATAIKVEPLPAELPDDLDHVRLDRHDAGSDAEE